MWPRKRSFSERCHTIPEEALMYQFQRQKQQSRSENDWNIGPGSALPSRVIFSRPAQRKTNHGTRRLFDINKVCRKTVPNGNNENYILSQNDLGEEVQFFNGIPKTIGHNDNLNCVNEHCRQESPLKEITMNRRKPHFKNAYEGTPKPHADVFNNRHVTEKVQEHPDSFRYDEDSCYQNFVSIEDSPIKSSVFSKDFGFSECFLNFSSETYYHKFSASSTYHSEEPCINSQGYISISPPPLNKLQSCSDCNWHVAKWIDEEPQNQLFLETPESGEERMSPVTESLYKRISILKEEFGDLSDDSLYSPEQTPAPAKFDFLSADKVPSPSFRSTSQPNGQRSPFVQFQPYLTDPDEEYAKNVRTHAAPAKSLSQEFSFFLKN